MEGSRGSTLFFLNNIREKIIENWSSFLNSFLFRSLLALLHVTTDLKPVHTHPWVCIFCLELSSGGLLGDSVREQRIEVNRIYTTENSPIHLSGKVLTAFVPSTSLFFFFSLFYLQTLIFLAENRKPYQIGITVPLAVVFFPQRRDEFEPRQKAICCVRTDSSEPEKENEERGEGEALAFTHFKTKRCGLCALRVWQRLTMWAAWEHRVRVLHCAWWPCRTLFLIKKRRQVWPSEPGPVLDGKWPLPTSSLPSLCWFCFIYC